MYLVVNCTEQIPAEKATADFCPAIDANGVINVENMKCVPVIPKLAYAPVLESLIIHQLLLTFYPCLEDIFIFLFDIMFIVLVMNSKRFK